LNGKITFHFLSETQLLNCSKIVSSAVGMSQVQHNMTNDGAGSCISIPRQWARTKQ